MNLVEYLLKYRLSASEFAKKIGISATTIYRYTNYGSTPRLPIALLIEEATNKEVSVEELMETSKGIYGNIIRRNKK